MDKRTQVEIIRHAARWCNSILTEVQANYGEDLPAEKRVQLHSAIQSLSDFQHAWTVRDADPGQSAPRGKMEGA